MSKRTPTVVDWHAGRLASEALAEALGDELLAELDRFTASQRRHAQPRYGPAWHVEEWWGWYREELDLTGFSAEDYTVLLEHLTPRLPKWGLRRSPTPLEPTERTVARGGAARLYLDVEVRSARSAWAHSTTVTSCGCVAPLSPGVRHPTPDGRGE